MIKYFLFILLFLSFGLLCRIVQSEEGEFSLCDIMTYEVIKDGNHNRLYVTCTGSATELIFKAIDPYTLDIDKSFIMNGLIDSVYSIENGQSLVVLLSNIVGSQNERDGKIIKVDYDTGDILNAYYFPTREPLAMVIDPSETYAYVTSGLQWNERMPRPMLSKISLSNFQIVDEVEIGDTPHTMVANHDFTKLYIRTENHHKPNAYDPYTHYEIDVIDPVDLSKCAPICIPFSPMSIEINDGDRLFISYSAAEQGYPAIWVVNTLTNTIIERLVFGDIGVSFMSYEPTTQTLAASLYPINFWYEQDQEWGHGASTEIALIDLTDPNYGYETISLGTENHWGICTVPAVDTCNYKFRIFASVKGQSPTIYYKDVPCPPNQPPSCTLCTITPMPYIGSSPASIEFLAEASDPDNDELTFHWDFDGDLIFDEPVDDSYTGDPYNPTHVFTQAGIHTVTLRVTDPCEGMCEQTIAVEIEFE